MTTKFHSIALTSIIKSNSKTTGMTIVMANEAPSDVGCPFDTSTSLPSLLGTLEDLASGLDIIEGTEDRPAVCKTIMLFRYYIVTFFHSLHIAPTVVFLDC